MNQWGLDAVKGDILMLAGSQPRVPLRRRRGWAWFRLLRPRAMLAGMALTVGFAFIAEGGDPSWHVTLRLALAMAALLAAAAAADDALDASHDRQAFVWRPISSGLVSVRAARWLALVLALVALALGGSLGWRPLLLTGGGLLAAALYSLRLKSTLLSWLPFAAAFALVPLWVYEAFDRVDDFLRWAVPVGMVAGLAFYLAVKLPDYERDDVEGRRNLLHWLTIDYALPLTWGALGACIVVAAASANIEQLRVEWIAPPAALALLAALVSMVLFWRRVTERHLVVQRWLLSAAVLAVALGWLGSVTP